MSRGSRRAHSSDGGLLLGLWSPSADFGGGRHGRARRRRRGDIRDSTITIGLTPKQVRELVDKILAEADADTTQVVKLATELGVTQGAVTTFLRTLGEKDIPIEELPAKLGEIAKRHRNLLAQIEQVRSASPDVQAIKDQAKATVEQGNYDRAEDLLDQSRGRGAGGRRPAPARCRGAARRARRAGEDPSRLPHRRRALCRRGRPRSRIRALDPGRLSQPPGAGSAKGRRVRCRRRGARGGASTEGGASRLS